MVDCEFLKGSDACFGPWRNYRKAEQVVYIFLASATSQVWAFAAKEIQERRFSFATKQQDLSPSDNRLNYIK